MYDADYYLRGKQTGQSLYENYRWLPELTIPMAQAMCDYLDIYDDTVLDFGCARGYLVKAFRELGVECFGVDISEWAISNCDPDVKRFVTCGNDIPEVDWIVAKDVLEHVPAVATVVNNLLASAKKGIFAVVPLSKVDGHPYVVLDYEKDVTHIHRLTLSSWAKFFCHPDFEVTIAYRVPGIKDNYANYAYGNGFITARRICEQLD